MKVFSNIIFKTIKRIMLPLASKDDIDALQSFAISMAIAFPIVFMLLLPWLLSANIPLWPALLSLILVILYLIKPLWLYAPYMVWMVIASILGWINTKIILAFAYYLLIVPIGVTMRMLRKLQYRRYRYDESSWITRENKPTKENLKEPF